ncbi:hypothetical protein [Nostocoides sp. HKS02]|uniref:hypothetical protein n=1 Tax=Nostocoides sp. HKS02 TaxID=1813880 RepID=UPI0012B45DC4|nr:hypothetical protein [Tetrasphaera sp. HKS02]QGN58456.1 hypothetical protein GKE56_11815 [Tetrasphaera sp. HKS02]
MPTARRKAAAPKGRATPADERPVLLVAGPPSQLRTTVTVENTAGQQVAVRAAALHREGESVVPGGVAALIPAGATATVPVSFAIAPGTPPGEYAAEVEVGGTRRAAVVRVEPHLSMHVSPRRVLAEAGRQAIDLVVSNDGNLDVTVAALARARTDDGGPEPGPDVSLALDDAVVVAAATQVSTTAHLEVPAGLDPTRRHTASIPVGLADLDVIILPRTGSESPS